MIWLRPLRLRLPWSNRWAMPLATGAPDAASGIGQHRLCLGVARAVALLTPTPR